MNIRRFQGWALITSALISLYLFRFYFNGFVYIIPYTPELLRLASATLFLFGLSGIQTVQPKTKYWGRVGITLMLIPPFEQFVLGLIELFVEHPLSFNNFVFSIWEKLASVGVVYLGYILVGWLTIRARVFPVWVGWFLFAAGIFYNAIELLVSYVNLDFVPLSYFQNAYIFLNLLEIAALIGYGWTVVSYKTFLDSNQIKVLHSKGDIESLNKILQKKNESDWMFRLDAAEALAQLGIEQGMNYLIARLQSSDTDERNETKEIIEELNIRKSNLAIQSHE